MNAVEILATLKKFGKPQTAAIYKRHGAGDNVFGTLTSEIAASLRSRFPTRSGSPAPTQIDYSGMGRFASSAATWPGCSVVVRSPERPCAPGWPRPTSSHARWATASLAPS
jgi:hypothetical protein